MMNHREFTLWMWSIPPRSIGWAQVFSWKNKHTLSSWATNFAQKPALRSYLDPRSSCPP